ncbi:MAG: response regulator [Polaromonas sp.]|uniref:response regulator n=1 Tax=Polaromonas sp. TaxID=1869339 RepID=UPI00271FD19F|nr:response regulator [Polaromonas sp.]MDO9112784.1 response regulator [Polaromonas sp.]MDP1886954.1 response regulator [Polaromonas sp.]
MLLSTFLVEDKPEIRDTVVEAMEEVAPLKFVGHAASEAAARQWLRTFHDDWQLAIVDLFLSEGSGFGVLRDCQARKPSQKVVVLTSYCHQNITDHCLQLGADKVFDKAADLEELVAFCKAHADSLDRVVPQVQPSSTLH